MNYLVFGLVVVLFACSNENKVKDLNFSDLSSPSSRYDESESQEMIVEKKDIFFQQLPENWKHFIEIMLWEKEGINELDTLFFPDRFKVVETVKWNYISQDDSLVFMVWNFNDSTQAENVFFNWLDCFGENCKSLKVNESKAISKRSFLLFLNENKLIFFESNKKIKEEPLMAALDSIGISDRWKFILQQQPRSKCSWRTNFQLEKD
jgi:hypothetical protein